LLLEGVMLAANRHRLMVKVMSLGFARSIQALVDICRGYRLAGLIAYELFDPAVLGDLRQRLARHGIPVVIAAGGPDAERIGPGVVADNLQGGRLALEHLAERGHRRVFVLSNYSGKRWADERCRGFENAAREAGLALSPLYLAGYRLPGAREIAARICAARATGVFCVSDYAALAVVGSLQRAGRRVPEDVAVIGYGNLPFCKSARPALSSVDEHLGRIGGRAVDLLIQTLKAGPQDRAAPAEICPVTLVPRDSTRGRRTPAAATGGRPAAAG